MGCCDSSESKEHTILFVGTSGCGKTTVLYKVITSETVAIVPTCGGIIESTTYGGKSLKMVDMHRDRQYTPAWCPFAETAAVVILVIDSNDPETLDSAGGSWTVDSDLDNFLTEPRLIGKPFLILANKQDEPRAMSVREITERLELEQRMKDRKWHIQPCCATSGQGISEGMDWVVACL